MKILFEFHYPSAYTSFRNKGKVMVNGNSWKLEWHDHVSNSSLENVLYNLNRVSKPDLERFIKLYPEYFL